MIRLSRDVQETVEYVDLDYKYKLERMTRLLVVLYCLLFFGTRIPSLPFLAEYMDTQNKSYISQPL